MKSFGRNVWCECLFFNHACLELSIFWWTLTVAHSFIHSFVYSFMCWNSYKRRILPSLSWRSLIISTQSMFVLFHPLSMFVPRLSASFFSWVLILQKKTTFKNQWSMIFKARSAPLFDSCLSPPPPPAADMAAVPSPSSLPVQVANQDVMNIFMWPWRTCCFFWWQFQ